MTQLRSHIYPIILVILTLGAYACSDTLWDDLPSPVSEFISRYFPEESVVSEQWTDGDQYYTVKLKDDAWITFDKSLKWQSVNGRGVPLPEIFLFDELPPAVYEYLQEIESLAKVYRATRTQAQLTLELLDDTVVYDYHTGVITMPEMVTEAF